MKKFFKYFLLPLILIVSGLMIYVKFFLPNVGSPEIIQYKPTEKDIERGKYLAHHVAVCMDCHSERDWSLFSGPLKEGTLGKGGEAFTQTFGFPGKFYAKT